MLPEEREKMIVPSFVERVVKSCLRIGKDDRVTIFAWRHMLDLAEALAVECERSGARVHTEFTTDDLWYDAVLNRPIDYLETPDPFNLALAGIATACIFISGPENPERLKGVPAERWMALSRADRPSYEKLLERGVRIADINLGYVTPQRARTYGFDYQAWKKNVEEAIDVEYERMQELGRRVADVLEKSHDVIITDPDGTDLSFALEGRKAHVYDGVIDDTDVEMRTTYANLPGGYVAVAATETNANGVLSSSVPFAQLGTLIHRIDLRFEKGKLTSFEGDKNIDVLKDMWKKGTGDKDKIGWLAIGLNPKANLGFLNNQIVLGTATVGIGFNKELGGTNESDYALSVTVGKPTVKLDGKTIIKQGKLAL
jgi:leucyl aminopeptidase (aminopeptidase T)